MKNPVRNSLFGNISRGQDSSYIPSVWRLYHIHFELHITAPLLLGEPDKTYKDPLIFILPESLNRRLIQIGVQKGSSFIPVSDKARNASKERFAHSAKPLKKSGIRIVYDLQYPVLRNVAVAQNQRIGPWCAVVLEDQILILAAKLFLFADRLANISIHGIESADPVRCFQQ